MARHTKRGSWKRGARSPELPRRGSVWGAAHLTSAVPEVGVAGRVVLAQPLQDLLVVHEPVQRAQEEGVEGQVAHLLQLEVSAQALQPPGAPDAALQGLQSLAVLPQVSRQRLVGRKARGTRQAGSLAAGKSTFACTVSRHSVLCIFTFHRSLHSFK